MAQSIHLFLENGSKIFRNRAGPGEISRTALKRLANFDLRRMGFSPRIGAIHRPLGANQIAWSGQGGRPQLHHSLPRDLAVTAMPRSAATSQQSVSVSVATAQRLIGQIGEGIAWIALLGGHLDHLDGNHLFQGGNPKTGTPNSAPREAAG